MGIISGGIPSTSSTCASHSDGERVTWSPVTAALVASVTCTAPFDSVHATHVSTVPKHSSRAAGAIGQLLEQPLQLRRRLVGTAAHALRRATSGTRRSCAGPAIRYRARPVRPSPGPTRRWNRAGRRCRPNRPVPLLASAAVASSRHTSAIARASNCTMPSDGVSGSSSRSTLCCTAPPASYTPTRMLLVPTSTTSTRSLLMASRLMAKFGSWPGELAERGAQAELAGIQDPVRDRVRPSPIAARRTPRRARRRRTATG